MGIRKYTLTKLAVILVATIVIVSLIPILYCGMFNYASADDYEKAAAVYHILKYGGNIWGAIVTAVHLSYETWLGWEGTWSSNFFLAMEPSIFGEHWYAITVPLGIMYIALGTGYFLHEVLSKWFGLDRTTCSLVYFIQLFLCIQYMPFIRGGLFWYTGMAHYIMPLFFALLFITWIMKWYRTRKTPYIWLSILCGIYLGGSHYQQILIVLLAILTLIVVGIIRKSVNNEKMRPYLLWLIPFAIISVGLIICVKSPGNAIRGGSEMDFGPINALLTPIRSIQFALIHIGMYVRNVPLILLLWGISLAIGYRNVHVSYQSIIRYYPLTLVYLFLMYAAVEAPGIFAENNTNGISGGYYDVVYIIMILTSVIAFLVVGKVIRIHFGDKIHQLVDGKWPIIIGACILLLIVFLIGAARSSIKDSATYLCWDFTRSGRLEDFVIQMEERIALMQDENLKDVVVPEMNDDQGPFMHLQLSADPTNYTNEASCHFYEKNSVKVVARDIYYKEYASEQGHPIPEAYKKIYN